MSNGRSRAQLFLSLSFPAFPPPSCLRFLSPFVPLLHLSSRSSVPSPLVHFSSDPSALVSSLHCREVRCLRSSVGSSSESRTSHKKNFVKSRNVDPEKHLVARIAIYCFKDLRLWVGIPFACNFFQIAFCLLTYIV